MTAGPVTVIGGAGRIGRLAVGLLLDEGVPVRLVSRHAHRARDLAGRGVTVYEADIRKTGDLAESLDGASGVMISIEPGSAQPGPDRPEATMYQGARNALAACGPQTERIVLVSQIYVTRPDNPINQWGGTLDWRLRGEDAVRASDIPCTVVRPSWLTEGRSAGPAVRLEQGDRGDGQISRSDVAEACLQAFLTPHAIGKTFEMYNGLGESRTDWDLLLSALQPDPAFTSR